MYVICSYIEGSESIFVGNNETSFYNCFTESHRKIVYNLCHVIVLHSLNDQKFNFGRNWCTVIRFTILRDNASKVYSYLTKLYERSTAHYDKWIPVFLK